MYLTFSRKLAYRKSISTTNSGEQNGRGTVNIKLKSYRLKYRCVKPEAVMVPILSSLVGCTPGCNSGATLLWRHSGCDGVSDHQPHECLLKRSSRHRSKKPSKLRVSGLYVGNSPGTGEFPAQMASNAENVSFWWRHHEWRQSWQALWQLSDFSVDKRYWGLFYQYGLTLTLTCISNYIHYRVWNEVNYPFPNFNGCTTEVWKWIRNFIPHSIMDAITYPCQD